MVEAAIIMPIFIVAVITLAYLVKVIWIQENVFHDLVNESRKLSIECYVHTAIPDDDELPEAFSSSGMINQVLFEYRMSQAIKAHRFNEVQGHRIEAFQYSGQESDSGEEIKIEYGYDIQLPLPLPIVQNIYVENAVLFHGWTGRSGKGTPMGFSQMGQEETSQTVYIFPRAGEKYHRKSCRYVSVYPVRVPLSQSIKSQYSNCGICNSGSLNLGSVVFIFSDSGRVFHRGSCSTVDKYVITMDKKDAELKGYHTCNICGG